MSKQEQTLVIVKPDGVNRGIVGDIINRLERKGLKIVGIKMVQLTDEVLDIHYSHHKDKPFFAKLKAFMKYAPTIAMVVEGNYAISSVRSIAGPTRGYEAMPGTIRGDFSSSASHNVVHASEHEEAAKEEIKRFFKEDEIFSYNRIDWTALYEEDERD